MTKLDQDRYIVGRQAAHEAANVPTRATLSWGAPRGSVVPVETPLPKAVEKSLGLEWTGANPDGTPTGYVKPEESDKPDVVGVSAAPARRALVAPDGTAMPEGTEEEDRWEGLRPIVARECDVDNRRAGGAEYYAEKYPAFVKMAEREMDGKARAAALAASHGVRVFTREEK